MGTNIIIVAISSVTAIVVAAFTTKQREREAEWRREKLAHYTDYFARRILMGTSPNELWDASGGSVFLNLIRAEKLNGFALPRQSGVTRRKQGANIAPDSISPFARN